MQALLLVRRIQDVARRPVQRIFDEDLFRAKRLLQGGQRRDLQGMRRRGRLGQYALRRQHRLLHLADGGEQFLDVVKPIRIGIVLVHQLDEAADGLPGLSISLVPLAPERQRAFSLHVGKGVELLLPDQGSDERQVEVGAQQMDGPGGAFKRKPGLGFEELAQIERIVIGDHRGQEGFCTRRLPGTQEEFPQRALDPRIRWRHGLGFAQHLLHLVPSIELLERQDIPPQGLVRRKAEGVEPLFLLPQQREGLLPPSCVIRS